MRQVTIVGGGLVGSLLAVFLRRRDYAVVVYEARPDPRTASLAGGRSINLIVTERGIHALREVGLWEAVSAITSRVTGRMMHDRSGEQAYQPYGKDDSECNHSVSRGGLNNLLLNAAENSGAELRFGYRLIEFDPADNSLCFGREDGSETQEAADLVFGADGAASRVRAGLMRLPGASESIDMLGHGYKELEFPPAADGGHAMEPSALHIWPRGEFMLMALPNPDGSFTGTLYLPTEGRLNFDALIEERAAPAFFNREFPDAVPLLPNLTDQFGDHPTGELGTVRCTPWHADGNVALIGDAAHAIVPFFGQGMNAGFEDCTVLDEILSRFEGDWERVLPAYDDARKPNGDAIAEMALDNFVEMRERVGDPAFLLRKEVEHRLEQAYPTEFRSRYSMVVYSRIPYAVCREAGRLQAEMLAGWCRDIRSADDLDLGAARADIQRTLTPFLNAHNASLDY